MTADFPSPKKPALFYSPVGAAIVVAFVALIIWRAETDINLPEVPAPAPAVTAGAPTAERVPGGGLEAHERLGGHTLARHVGRTEAELKERLAREPNISAASSFFDRDTAETAVAEALAARAAMIERWLHETGDRLELPDYTCPQPIGRSLRRGATQAQAVRKVRIILQRRASAPPGYFVLTAYPQT